MFCYTCSTHSSSSFLFLICGLTRFSLDCIVFCLYSPHLMALFLFKFSSSLYVFIVYLNSFTTIAYRNSLQCALHWLLLNLMHFLTLFRVFCSIFSYALFLILIRFSSSVYWPKINCHIGSIFDRIATNLLCYTCVCMTQFRAFGHFHSQKLMQLKPIKIS